MMTTSSDREPVTFTARGVIGTLLLFLVAALCVRFGFWQLDRLEQRRDLNAALVERADGPPLAQPDLLLDSAGIVFRAASIAGHYDHARSIVVPARSFHGAPGVHLLTPLLPEGRSWAILVNRGWVPAPDGATIRIDELEPVAEATVAGILLPLPAPAGGKSAFITPMPAGQGDGRAGELWFAENERDLRDAFPYPIAAVQLQRAPVSPDDGRAPVALQPPPLDEGPHMGYAVQWFGFALIGIFGWFALVLRSRHGPSPIRGPRSE
jgi:surfeit locus 1 family protein